MAMWCDACEEFVNELEGFRCSECKGPLLARDKPATPDRGCVTCTVEVAMANSDICRHCDGEIRSGSYSFEELLDLFPELCAECFLRVQDDTTGLCDVCYAEVCWDAPVTHRYGSESLTGYYASGNPKPAGQGWGGYSFWDEEEPDLPIPAVADELESIPAIRVAA